MAQSKFEYVKLFEEVDTALPNTYIVVRIDGRGFHQFSDQHCFSKPTDDNAISLMNAAASEVMNVYRDIFISYGQSDEYSFALRRDSTLFKRRKSKIASTLVSLFTSVYVAKWPQFMSTPLMSFPSFDSRCVLYPTFKNLRDYFSWRQVDCHINNMYNYCFWKLVLDSKMEGASAEKLLSPTDSAGKNELLFSRFNINYNTLPLLHRKGTVLFWDRCRLLVEGKKTPDGMDVYRERNLVQQANCDIIKDEFWIEKNFTIQIDFL
ncbi:hypothetical protein GEMRC1_008063 [Eukaryota sp. GEM-RC1]